MIEEISLPPRSSRPVMARTGTSFGEAEGGEALPRGQFGQPALALFGRAEPVDGHGA
jgi:hypothetical protein